MLKEYKRGVKGILKSKLNGKNKIMAASSWAVAVLRKSAGVVERKTKKLNELDRKTRKIMTLYGALHQYKYTLSYIQVMWTEYTCIFSQAKRNERTYYL